MVTKWNRGSEQLQHDEAILRAVLVHGVPVRTLAQAMRVSRQTVYRRMQRAKVNLRRAAEAAITEAQDH